MKTDLHKINKRKRNQINQCNNNNECKIDKEKHLMQSTKQQVKKKE